MNTVASILSNSGMSAEGISFGFFTGSKDLPSLKSVAISGTALGLLFTYDIRQEYKNETKKTLEIIYTFPVAWGTTLLGLHAEIGGKRLQGKVTEKKQAERQYEKAITEGDSPVMVQQSDKGLYTANLGNIRPGDSVVVEIHCARLLAFEQGRIRLCIPTVISERYGDPHEQGVLAPHESAMVDVGAKYPFSLQIHLIGDVATRGVSCPTHSIRSSSIENGLCVTLENGTAVLDRDFVLLMEGLAGTSFAQYVQNEEETMILASFAPSLPQQVSAPLAMKILVDCSGSMDGQRIAQAKSGLQRVITELQAGDSISYSRFGSTVEHSFAQLCECSPPTIQKLVGYVAQTEANLGGTEMEEALASVFGHIAMPLGSEVPPSVLLVTDGDVWDIDGIIRASKASGHRIFAVGVGSAPSESLLREMAEQTGGACEFVTPNEDMARAILRMFHRMRGVAAQDIQIQWGMKPVWQSTLPKYLYDGETVHFFAVTPKLPKSIPELSWKAQGRAYTAQAENMEKLSNDTLLRLGKTRQMEAAKSPKKKLQIALAHQLVSDQTSLILTYVREDKAEGIPTIQHVWQMPADGHGCYDFMASAPEGFVNERAMLLQTLGCNPASISSSTSSPKTEIHPHGEDAFIFDEADMATPAFLGKQRKIPPVAQKLDILAFVALWNKAVYQSSSFAHCLAFILADAKNTKAKRLLSKLCQEVCVTDEQVWAVFIEWALEKTGNPVDRHAKRLLDTVLPGIPQENVADIRERLDKLFP